MRFYLYKTFVFRGLTGLAWGEYITHTRVEQERRRVDVFVTSPLISFLPSKSSAKGRSRSTDRERDHFSFFPSKSIKWLLIPKPLLTVISKSSSITSIPSLTSWIPSISSVRSSVIPKSSLSYITSISSSPSRTSWNGIISISNWSGINRSTTTRSITTSSTSELINTSQTSSIYSIIWLPSVYSLYFGTPRFLLYTFDDRTGVVTRFQSWSQVLRHSPVLNTNGATHSG